MAHGLLISLVAPLLAVFFLLSPVHAFKISVSPGRTECVYETIGSEHFEGDAAWSARVDGRILINGNSQYYVPFIDIKVSGPRGEKLHEQYHAYQEAHFNVPAAGPGRYEVCYRNSKESRTDANVDLVYITLAHLRNKGKGKVQIPKGTEAARATEFAHTDHIDQVNSAITSMSEFVQVIMGSQRYLQRKLDRHLQTMVSNKNRTLNYASLEVLVLLAVTGVQIWGITKMFAKGKIRNFNVLSV